MIDQLLAAIAGTLRRAGVSEESLAEVTALATRHPEDAAIAIVGPQNAGKTTLIAVLTDDPAAKQDIGPGVMTQVSRPSRYERHGTTFEVWDTPGLGSEFLDHDQEARERITRADAVVVALSSELVSQRGRDQLDELLTLGRKRGAVLFVVTKADREPAENRSAISQQLQTVFDVYAPRPLFISAGDVLDAREDGDPEPADAGIAEFVEDLEGLALSEARQRIVATGAVRLLVLIDEAEGLLAGEEPEQRAALTIQRRLRKVLRRGDRRINEALAQAQRKARRSARQAAASIASALDERVDPARVSLVAEDAYNTFVADATRHEEDLAEAVAEELRQASAELERLEQGTLAEALRKTIGELDEHAYGDIAQVDEQDLAFGRKLLDALKRAAKLAQDAKFAVKGKPIPAGMILKVGAEVADWYLTDKETAAIDEAKRGVSKAYLAEAEKLSERWEEFVSEARDETTRRLLAETSTIEEQLFGQLVATQDQLRALRDSRDALDGLVDDAIKAGYADPSAG